MVSAEPVAYARDDLLPLTRRQYDLLVDAVEFEGRHVELIEGMELEPGCPRLDWSAVSRS